MFTQTPCQIHLPRSQFVCISFNNVWHKIE